MSLSDTTKTFDSDQENSAQNPIVSTTNMSPTATADAAPVILKRPVELSPSSEEPIVVNDDLSTPFDGSVKSASPTPSEGSNAEEVVTADNEWGLDSILLTAVQSSKDRLFVLRTEKECADFIHDESQTTLEFPHMNSYQRLLTHRIAVHFKLEHVSDASRRGVVLYKGSGTAIPELNLSDIPVNDAVVAPTQTASFKIMKRHHNHHGRSSRHSSTDSGSENGIGGGPKTLEEREAAYQAARARIFQDDAGSDASSNSRTSGQSTSASTGKSAMRNGKGTGRNQNARPRHTNQAGMGRHRMPHGLTHGGVPSALTQIPMGDVSRGTTYYPYEPTGRNQHMASNTAPPYRGGAPPYVPQYPGLNQGVPSSNYNAPYGVPQHQNYTQANPYADWNPSTYPGYSGVPMGNSGSRTGREPRRPDAYLPGMGAPGVGYNADLGTSGNLSYHQFTAPPLQNPRLHAPFFLAVSSIEI
ncbi:uncharacterized protein EV422DRAFT_216724 [Fimicolochytrium jonesii]|uniref:uncharacterized protein n=1 Tax=Fimicolochytrium jonesii TaxID=1396493 RepID=UPI0022FE5BC6|nr:uncharacterized protein EV422DRAFT_216724 [Fimicolochytrium jonesii]KAI8817529.1 hypothetical protein EV422DRAFT_216724 [Fimicolochytrium jonesii]